MNRGFYSKTDKARKCWTYQTDLELRGSRWMRDVGEWWSAVDGLDSKPWLHPSTTSNQQDYAENIAKNQSNSIKHQIIHWLVLPLGKSQAGNCKIWPKKFDQNFPFLGFIDLMWHSVSMDPASVSAKWYLHPSNCLSKKHECDKETDRFLYLSCRSEMIKVILHTNGQTQ